MLTNAYGNIILLLGRRLGRLCSPCLFCIRWATRRARECVKCGRRVKCRQPIYGLIYMLRIISKSQIYVWSCVRGSGSHNRMHRAHNLSSQYRRDIKGRNDACTYAHIFCIYLTIYSQMRSIVAHFSPRFCSVSHSYQQTTSVQSKPNQPKKETCLRRSIPRLI